MKKYLSLLIISGICFGQSQFQIKPKYSHLKLINKWVFQSMETITYNDKEEREVVLKDQYNTETLSFHRSGSMTFETLSSGGIKKGRGLWHVKNDILKILTDTDTVDATYYIENDILRIITSEEESSDFYGYKTTVTYKR